MLIEADKRKKQYAIKLTYSNEDDERFFVPENVYLIGCMNTADRSLAIVDYALRRRFRFCPIKPEFNEAFINFLEEKGISQKNAELVVSKVKSANEVISPSTEGWKSGTVISVRQRVVKIFLSGGAISVSMNCFRIFVKSASMMRINMS